MIVLDTEYNVVSANTAYQREFGIAGQPVLGHKCYRVSHHYDVPCDQAGEHCPMKKAFEKRGPDRVLNRPGFRGGSVTWNQPRSGRVFQRSR